MMEERPQSAPAANSAVPRHATDAFLILGFLYISLRVFHDYRMGGDSWKQGDWLINNLAGNVRRGPFGSTILAISDFVGSNPLLIVSAIQILFLAILFISFRILVVQSSKSQLWTLLLFSPAIFTVFWIADPHASVRKELLTFAGLSLTALGAVRENKLLFWLGILTFCISMWSHEAMVLFIPTFFAIIFVSEFYRTAFTHALTASVIVSASSVLALTFAINNSQAVDTLAICAPLIERGLDETICDGAIRWLVYDGAFGFQAVISSLNFNSVGGFLFSYAAALAPLSYFIWIGRQRAQHIVILFLLALPFVPLYFVGVDWGRWMSFHIFSACILLACAMAKDTFPIRKNPSNYHILLLASLALLISPHHTIGVVWGGAVRRAAAEFWRLLS